MTIAALRYNNPFDVSVGRLSAGFGGTAISGIPGQSGFASFPSLEAGFGAGNQVIQGYIDRGDNTISSMFSGGYATGSAWPGNVSNFSGLSLNTPITSSNLPNMEYGVMRAEGLSASQADTAQDQYQDRPTYSGLDLKSPDPGNATASDPNSMLTNVLGHNCPPGMIWDSFAEQCAWP
jgi:hypothetical protein